MEQGDTPHSEFRSNVPELSVSELAFSLKKTLEETYGRVRVRGELSRVTIPGSGHMYSDIKDDKSVINAVCWKGTLSKLPLKPEEGLEVICTGRISTYPARSNYQLIIEDMELAGEGALLKMLEERKKKLAAEGLFEEARKKKRPFLPQRIGVVTSPTGAVIRDIMHRLNDRFPRDVVLWPVLVQGEGAAEQIAVAIDGLNALSDDKRPDLIIVARGGGSLEDLMAFNEEVVVRAAANSKIPLISAVGHETDTTLIDYASDLRAPTPTGAAEMAVPLRLDLLAQVREDEKRLFNAMRRLVSGSSERVTNIGARLGDPRRLLENKIQALDHVCDKYRAAFKSLLSEKRAEAGRLGAMLRHPKALLTEKSRELGYQSDRLLNVQGKIWESRQDKLQNFGRLLKTLSYEDVLKRGYVVVRDQDGKALTSSAKTHTGQSVQLQFHDGRQDAVIGEGGENTSEKPKKLPQKAKKGSQTGGNGNQGQLF